MTRLRVLMSGVALAGLLLSAGPSGAATSSQGPVAALAAAPVPTGIQVLIDVSKDGRIALGRLTETGPVVIRDLVTNKTLRTLKSTGSYTYKSLSSNGRYVSFNKSYKKGACTYSRPWVLDRRTGRARLAATTRAGRQLRPMWSQASGCAQFSTAEASFGTYFHNGTVGPGQMSPDGRFVAFCANLIDPARGDLYIKDMKTRKLTIRPGICHWTSDVQELYAPHVTEAARTIMLPFNDQGSTLSHRVDVLLNRTTLRTVAVPDSERLMLTDDGSAIYYQVGGTNDAGRYDTATAAVTPLFAGDPMRRDEIQPGKEYREPQGMTRRGRYVSYHGSRITDPSVDRVGLIGVFDRDTGVAVDLTPALIAAGVPLQITGNVVVPNSLIPAEISGDGQVIFFPAATGWVSVRWMG
jgi:hypothetical protein